MSSVNVIASEKLHRLIGTPRRPALIDVRSDEDFAADPRLIPGSIRKSHSEVREWAGDLDGGPAVVICRDGGGLSQGVAAFLRHAGAAAECLEGGVEAWKRAGFPRVDAAKPPKPDGRGHTLWVTRERPKIDRIACPWLIRRFVDPAAAFLFVAPPEVEAVAEKFGAAPFDTEGAFWSHRGELCTFDVMVEELGLASRALLRLATIVRGADTARLDLAPEAPGLLAASLGLSRMYADDLEQLHAGFTLYDALYRWCRDATNETHHSPPNRAGA